MKYGLLYYKKTDNIGDDIQTYAQKRFLPKIDYLIDRESLGMFVPVKQELVSVIMNGWYMHNDVCWPPSPYINPLLISMHFSSNERLKNGCNYLDSLGGDYLRKYAPIGCRDEVSMQRLKSKNIDNYFSGCMTLTIKPFEGLKRKKYICLVDVDEKIEKKIKKNTNKKIIKTTHNVKPDEISELDIEERMSNVENLLKTYQQASLVVTSRLHVMLPCLALGTPVILVYNDVYEKDRFSSFLEYVNNFSKTEFLKEDIYSYINNPKKNDTKFMEISKNLEEKCTKFINTRVNNDIALPKLDEYKKLVEYKEYCYNLFENCRKSSIQNILDADKYFSMYKDTYKKLVEANKKLKKYEDKYSGLKKKYDYTINAKINKIYKKIKDVFSRKSKE